MHESERWQEYAHNGEALATNGRDPDRGNPELSEVRYVSSALVWLYRRTKDGLEILFQKRSPLVDRHPNLWDVSAGGHINLGETPTLAAVREVREEIGVDIQPEKLDFLLTARSKEKGLFLNEFLYDWTGHEDDFHFSDQEVSEVKWVPVAEFDNFLDNYAKPPLRDGAVVRLVLKIRLGLITGGDV